MAFSSNFEHATLRGALSATKVSDLVTNGLKAQ